jgi:hypothetical protein
MSSMFDYIEDKKEYTIIDKSIQVEIDTELGRTQTTLLVVANKLNYGPFIGYAIKTGHPRKKNCFLHPFRYFDDFDENDEIIEVGNVVCDNPLMRLMIDYVCDENRLKTEFSYTHETEIVADLIKSLSFFAD